jgi:putative redox protein
VGVAFGTCVVTIMGIAADKRGWNMKGAKVRVEKTMVADPDRRIDSLRIEVYDLPSNLDAKQREILEAAGNGCPVHHTLRADTKVDLTYDWNG